MGEDNRLAPPGGTLLNIDQETRPGTPAGTGPSGWASGRPSAAAEPSWGRVLATTVKLWMLRQVSIRRWWTIAVVAAAAVITVAALAVSGVFAGTAVPAARARTASTPSPAKVVPPRTVPQPSPAQTAAAVWIAGQLSSGAIIACDPAMCAALQAQGVAAGRLMPLTPRAPDPRGAAVVVTSAPAASQLIEAYAPAVIASFGSAADPIDVRVAEPGGAAVYQTALRADLAARVIAQRGAGPASLFAGVPLVVLGTFGSLATVKYHERYEYHMTRATHYLEVLADEFPQIHAKLIGESAIEIHRGKYPRLSRLRLWHLWIALHSGIAVTGAVLSLVILVKL